MRAIPALYIYMSHIIVCCILYIRSMYVHMCINYTQKCQIFHISALSVFNIYKEVCMIGTVSYLTCTNTHINTQVRPELYGVYTCT